MLFHAHGHLFSSSEANQSPPRKTGAPDQLQLHLHPMAGEEVKADEADAAATPAGCAAEHSDPVDSAAPAPAPEITARLSKEFVAWIMNRKLVSFNEDPDEYYNQMINDPDRPEEYTPDCRSTSRKRGT